MKKITFLIALMLTINVASAQTTERDLENFNKIKVSSAVNIKLIPGDNAHASISGVPEQYIENVKTEVVDGVLKIYVSGKVKAANDMAIAVTFSSLNSIEVSGASTIKSAEAISTDTLTIQTSGASVLDLEINAQKVGLITSGASEVKLKGFTKDFNATLSGASDLKARTFEANQVTINASGASDVDVYAAQEINGGTSGASDIQVFGNPPVNNLKKSGYSDVRIGENVNMKLGNNNVTVVDENVDVNVGNNNVNVINDTTRIKWGNTSILILDDSVSIKKTPKKRRNHWAGVDLGINGFHSPTNGFSLNNPAGTDTTNPTKFTEFMELDYAKSWVVNVNFFEHFFKIHKHHFGVVTGLGLEYNNYELRHNVALNSYGGSHVYDNVTPFNNSYTWGEPDTARVYSKNRFKTYYLNAPLLLEINTGQHKNKSFHLSAGAIVGYKFKTKMKYVYQENGDTQKYKDNQDFNTNPFRVSLTARVGYGWLNFFGTYSLTPLFEKNRGPELHAFSIGMTLLGF